MRNNNKTLNCVICACEESAAEIADKWRRDYARQPTMCNMPQGTSHKWALLTPLQIAAHTYIHICAQLVRLIYIHMCVGVCACVALAFDALSCAINYVYQRHMSGKHKNVIEKSAARKIMASKNWLTEGVWRACASPLGFPAYDATVAVCKSVTSKKKSGKSANCNKGSSEK